MEQSALHGLVKHYGSDQQRPVTQVKDPAGLWTHHFRSYLSCFSYVFLGNHSWTARGQAPGWQYMLASPSRQHWWFFLRAVAWMMPGRSTDLTMLWMLGLTNDTVWFLPQHGSQKRPKETLHTMNSLTAPMIPVFHYSSKEGRRWII